MSAEKPGLTAMSACMTSWRVVQEDGFPGVWSVARVDADGSVSYPQERWRGVACIDAQVIVAEMNGAYERGRQEVFAQGIGD